MHKKIISASILSANLANLGEDCKQVLNAGANWIHFDVMDYHFVPNLTFGAQVCQALRDSNLNAPIDVHLMVKKTNPLIKDFAKAGANLISIHPQKGVKETKKSIALIHSFGLKAGLAINPDEPIELLTPFINQIDLILVMSVYPGFAAQKFIPETLDKLKQLRNLIDKNPNHPVRLSVDGGVNLETIRACSQAGADTFITGSALFKSKNYQKTIDSMRGKIV